MIQPNDFFTKLDLSDAYFSIAIQPLFQKFLRFLWQGQLFTFICLPFGLSSAPRVYTKLLKPIFRWFWQQGFRCSYYIDDSLNMNQDKSICGSNFLTMVDTFQSLGFSINEESLFLGHHKELYFYLRRFSESRSSSGSTPSVRLSVRSSIRSSVRPSVRNTFGVPSLCNL